MKKYLISLISLTLLVFTSCQPVKNSGKKTLGKYVLVIHGGAGVIEKKLMTPEKEKRYRDKLQQVIDSGEFILKRGGSALDAVTKCITMMEDSPLFNAGKGSVFNARGENEMDASIMDGKNLMAGAVANVHVIKNPILAARAVMEHTPHVLLISKGAEIFAAKQGLQMEDSSYFFTESRWKSYLKVKAKMAQGEKHGTVGAVALDKHGNLAAGTSTGGMTCKMYGRVGDSPIIGAGTYADNATCAVSCTGYGEYFIRNVVAYDISALMKYSGLSLKEAANYDILVKLKKQGGEGGVIAVDRTGHFTMTFNTPGMFRAYATSEGFHGVGMYADQ
ncbi:MAG TPA: isoaspartyl peptidase/L-asparaginase [Bacteroidetes bacterium]|nr:isoaspartyl peptidase/L-asparaginase [Bacteroidota bacterium]